MTLKELLHMEPRTKRRLIKKLTKKNISWKYKKRNIIIDKLYIEEYENLKAEYIIVYGKVISLQLYFNKKIYSAEHIKLSLSNIFGTPIRDNTKHNLEYVRVHWNYDGRYIGLYDDYTDNPIVLNYNYPSKDLVKDNDKYAFGISMIGGIVWGILFFIFFGLGFSYSLLLFVLSMVGGLIWGLIFGLCMVKMGHYQGKSQKLIITEKDKNIFEQYEKNSLTLINGIYCFKVEWNKRRNRYFKSKLFIQHDTFIILKLDKKNLLTEIREFKNIKRYKADIDRGSIVIFFHDSPSMYLLNLENTEKIVQTLDNVLGYNTKRFFEIKSVIFNSFVEYDPESIIEGGAPKEVFLDDAKEVAIQICERKIIDVEILKYILDKIVLNSHLNSGMDGVNFDSLTLAINIFDDLQKYNLV